MMPNIKIFVSHRIDINSELISNPLYIPIRCGAVFDDKNPMNIAGDDTGDNISQRRMSFCEFTVQYWAWKNVQADYYGLCHYRRFLSFSDKVYPTDEYNMVHIPILTQVEARKFGLTDSARMEQLVPQFDVVVSQYADIRKIPTPFGKKDTLYEHWKAHEGEFFPKGTVDFFLNLLKNLHPELMEDAREYLNGHLHRGFNCFILKKELFFQLCQLQFELMFEVERRFDPTGCTQTMLRTPAFLGEILYGIFIYHLEKSGAYKIHELQLVFFQNTERSRGTLHMLSKYVWYYTDRGLRRVVDPICPKGTRRREMLKDVFYTVTPAKRRGVASPK